MIRTFMATLLLSLAPALVLAAETTAPAKPLGSGIDLQYIDVSVKPQEDLFRHVSGKWLSSVDIPADRARFGSFDQLIDSSEANLRAIIDELAAKKDLPAGVEARKIADLYNSFMDQANTEKHGLKPLRSELARIDGIKDKREIPAMLARLMALGVNAPILAGIDPDARDSSRYAVYLSQGGLGLPDRDYYLNTDDAKFKNVRAEYLKHVAKMLEMAGQKNSGRAAQGILDFETGLARIQWTKVDNRDPVKTYNKTEVGKLPELVAGYDWNKYFAATEIGDKVGYVIVRQPSYFQGLGKIIEKTPLPAWKTYFKWHLLKAYAPYLDQRFVDADFAFSGKTLRGIPENRPRWKRGVELVEQSMGEGLGRLYVTRHFPPQYKERMQALVGNLLTAYRQSIETLDWMSPETKKEALIKLSKFTPKIGYPDKWRDYGALTVKRDDLVGNVLRARLFEYRREIAKLGQPIDRGEWYMTPQTVNAYYNPSMNEIVFPAAILQPPFFNPAADDAVNYGGIGAVIGHEISHGFDDKGSQSDGDGNLRDWWTKQDHEKFAQRTRALVAQYSAFSPLPGYPINGELTLGENIADNSGLAIAYKAYKISLGGKEAPIIDGYTGDQRLYIGWSQVWRGKARDSEIIRRIKVDPHSPQVFRANVPLMNQPPFYAAFGVKAGDKMFLAPEQRIGIW